MSKLNPEFATAIHDLHHLTPEILLVDAQVHPYASLKWPAAMPTPTGNLNDHPVLRWGMHSPPAH